MRYHDWRFDIIDDLDNLRLNQYDERNYDNPVNVHDKPNVEFNDDGSVHINTPGDYEFRSAYNLDRDRNVIWQWRRRGDNEWNYYDWQRDDPALD